MSCVDTCYHDNSSGIQTALLIINVVLSCFGAIVLGMRFKCKTRWCTCGARPKDSEQSPESAISMSPDPEPEAEQVQIQEPKTNIRLSVIKEFNENENKRCSIKTSESV